MGGGRKGKSVNTYWYVDPEQRRFIIGHIGAHLRGKHTICGYQ